MRWFTHVLRTCVCWDGYFQWFAWDVPGRMAVRGNFVGLYITSALYDLDCGVGCGGYKSVAADVLLTG